MSPRKGAALLKLLGYAVAAFIACTAVVPRLMAKHRNVGQFQLTEYTTYYVFLLPEPHRLLSYTSGRFSKHVASEIGPYAIDPHDASRILYERCPDRVRGECGTFYFDGHTGKRHKVGPTQLIDAIDVDRQAKYEVHWSNDGRFAVLDTKHRSHVLNLETGASTDLGKSLGVELLKRYTRFVGFSDDSRRLALIVGDILDQQPPHGHVSEDVITLDLADNTMFYVATTEPDGWGDAIFGWQSSADGPILAVMPRSPDLQVSFKTPDQLPSGMQVQPRPTGSSF